jgi:TonB family protein
VSHPLLEASLRNLAAWSLQVGVLALVAAALSRLLPIERPSARLAFGQALLLLVIGLPVLQPWRSAALEGGWSFAITPLGASPSPATLGALSSAVMPAWPAVLAGLLLLGVLVQLTRIGVGLARIRSLRRRGRAWDLPTWLRALRDELAPRASLLLSDDTGTPGTFGLRQPTILLPTAFESMERERQSAIAAHELVHVQRHDWLFLILEELLKAVLFFHPAVHWLVGRVRLAREQTVDAAVVRRLGGREAYLASLVEVARIGLRARALPAAPFLGKSHLRERVDLLLKEVVMSRVRTQINVGVSAAAILLAVTWAVSAAPLQSAPTLAPAAPAVRSARFTTIDGGVQVRRVGTLEWVPATASQVLQADDLVRTGPAASAEIRFSDGSLFKVRPHSLIQIEAIAASPVPVWSRVLEDKAEAGTPRLVHKVNPAYPESAKADKVEGTFQLAVVVGKDGAVAEARVVASSSAPGRLDDAAALEGDPRLAEAAVAAVKQWRYQPFEVDGKAVDVKLTVTVVFRL